MILALLAAAAVQAAPAPPHMAPPSPAFAAAFICARPAVYDGDTFTCADRTRVRLWGVQAPEKRDAGGPAATAALAALVAGQDLACVPLGVSLDRVVARCFRLGPDVAADLVAAGAAADWPRFSGGFYAPPAAVPEVRR